MNTFRQPAAMQQGATGVPPRVVPSPGGKTPAEAGTTNAAAAVGTPGASGYSGRVRRRSPWTICGLVLAGCGLLTGCQGAARYAFIDVDKHIRPPYELPPPPEATVLRAGGVHWEKEAAPQPGTLAGDFASTLALFHKGKYYEAERWFHHLYYVAERQGDREMMENCLFWEAEALFAQGYYPRARDTYAKLLKLSPNSQHRATAIDRQQYMIYEWMKDIRADLEASADGRWFRIPRLVNFEKEKPFFGMEDYAVKACEEVFYQDVTGEAAAKALAMAGAICYAREQYDLADRYYSMLAEFHPKSSYAPRAFELGIQSKIQLVGGADYDTRKLGEARTMIDRALNNPDMKGHEDMLLETRIAINEVQAEKDFKTAEMYRRMGHPNAAYFQYEIVRRRYAGTEWERKSAARMEEIRAKAEKEAARQP